MQTHPRREPPPAVAIHFLAGALALLFVLPPVAAAEPPAWAPAWGHHARHDDKARVRSRNQDEAGPDPGHDSSIAGGTCHREQLGAIAGGALGGYIGSRLGDGDGDAVAVIAGTLIGMFVGSRIGRHMDQLDESCIGQVLERAPDGQVVTWRNSGTGADFRAEPVRTFRQNGRYCRDYLASQESAGDLRLLDGTACRHEDGFWHVL